MMSTESLIEAAKDYRRRLDEVSTGNEIRALWRETNLPYAFKGQDPLSESYRDEVLALYKGLTSLDYDVSQELTSTKQSQADFEVGYPWISRDPGIAAAELAKPVQVLAALRDAGPVHKVVEFGSGWGNLALPLAKIGLDVTAIDIDEAFLERLQRIASREQVAIETLHCDFLQAAANMTRSYDAAFFQSSFHHCADFSFLIEQIKTRVLKDEGCIWFFSEPIFKGYQFPWGLRFDGEALWAITKNGWLELGFDEDFFLTMLSRHGYVVSAVAGIPGLLGPGWKATPCAFAPPFAQIVLPAKYDANFHPPEAGHDFRFCRGNASLPGEFGLGHGAVCEISFRNCLPCPLDVIVTNGEGRRPLTIEAHQRLTICVPAGGGDIGLQTDTYVPNALNGSGDCRDLGVAVEHVSWRRG